MTDAFAALIFRPEAVSDEALSLGMAIALAGHQVARPRLDIAELPGAPGWSVAFYASGEKGPAHTPEDEVEHAEELWGDEDLPPAGAVWAAARALGGAAAERAIVYGLLYAPELELDEGHRFGGERVNVAGHERAGEGDHDGDDETGSALVHRELGALVPSALVKALFDADRRVVPRLADPSPAGVGALTQALVATLGRTPGRGAFEPAPLWGMNPPAAYLEFVRAYDWDDPRDPPDLYRGISLGGLEGTIRFLRPARAASLGTPPVSSSGAALFPVAELLSSTLADPQRVALLALDASGEVLVRVGLRGGTSPAGPTFAELLRYLDLGFRERTPFEEELIQSLLLRAAVRVS